MTPLAADDSLLHNMLSVLEYPKATATIRSSVNEVDGGARRHFVLCGSEGTFHIQPLDNPKATVALRSPRGRYAKGYQEITFPKYSRYVGDAAELAAVIRNEKDPDYSYEHDAIVQQVILESCGLPTSSDAD